MQAGLASCSRSTRAMNSASGGHCWGSPRSGPSLSVKASQSPAIRSRPSPSCLSFSRRSHSGHLPRSAWARSAALGTLGVRTCGGLSTRRFVRYPGPWPAWPRRRSSLRHAASRGSCLQPWLPHWQIKRQISSLTSRRSR